MPFGVMRRLSLASCEPIGDRPSTRGEPDLFMPEDVLDQLLQHFQAMIPADDLGVHGQNECAS